MLLYQQGCTTNQNLVKITILPTAILYHGGCNNCITRNVCQYTVWFICHGAFSVFQAYTSDSTALKKKKKKPNSLFGAAPCENYTMTFVHVFKWKWENNATLSSPLIRTMISQYQINTTGHVFKSCSSIYQQWLLAKINLIKILFVELLKHEVRCLQIFSKEKIRILWCFDPSCK